MDIWCSHAGTPGSIQSVADSRITLLTHADSPEHPEVGQYPEISIPIQSKGTLFGILNIHAKSDDSLNPQIRLFLEMLSSQAGYLLHGFLQQNPSEVVQEEPAIIFRKRLNFELENIQGNFYPETPSIQL